VARNRRNGIDWMGLPVIAVVARLLCRELTLENEYLRLENRIVKEKAQAAGRLRFTDEERRSVMEAALAMGRALMKEVVSIVRPETILAWQRRLERQKWDYSARRTQPGRPRTPGEIEALVCRLARDLRLGLPAHPGGTPEARHSAFEGLHRRYPAAKWAAPVTPAQRAHLATVVLVSRP